MKSIEQTVAILAKLYAARRGAQGLLGSEFATTMAEFQGFIRARMTRDRCDDLTATTSIVAGLQKEKPGSEVTQMYVLAAYVELVEPSPAAPLTADRRPLISTP